MITDCRLLNRGISISELLRQRVFRHKLLNRLLILLSCQAHLLHPIASSTIENLVCKQTNCKKDVGDVFISSHDLLTYNTVVSPSFEKHTTGIGFHLMKKMGYTRRGLKNMDMVLLFLLLLRWSHQEQVLDIMLLNPDLPLGLLFLGRYYLL